MLSRAEAEEIRAAAVAGDIEALDQVLATHLPEPVKKFPRDHVLALVQGRSVYQCQGSDCDMVTVAPGYCAACKPVTP